VTAILAVHDGHDVLIAADRAWVNGNGGLTILNTPKICRVGDWLVAVAGSLGGPWPLPETNRILALRDLLSLLPPPAAVDADDPGHLLLVRGDVHRAPEVHFAQGHSSGLWSAGAVRGPVAIGSGGDYALGAWDALGVVPRIPAAHRLQGALEISARCCTQVHAPWDIWSARALAPLQWTPADPD
jgi:hypothetical protein